ncbi:zinc metalloproteinase nas-7-like [Photinus pyralis]|uniref:zinc metalloproteinase nas-7-like n=1 Tax=Photinus pyralis TaxID=7054 RepID=UPI0012671BC0|nr:zinc metalloproteinase nas-7-like [Photinus pyralis]
MHAVGFQHQHSSPDRDNYIWIMYENIVDDQYGSFDIIQDVTSFGEPYDICTIMHYTDRAFSKNGEPTIVAKSDPGCVIGGAHEQGLTQIDKNKINHMYCS